jgi:DNA-binding response OmpR family regulator
MPGVMLMEEMAVATRALIVQSRPDVANGLSASLAAVGVEALVVADGQAALSAVGTWDPAVVLVDLTLAALDGWYVLAAVGALRDRPLLVVRVEGGSDAERAVALGADAWVDDDLHVVGAAGRLAAIAA